LSLEAEGIDYNGETEDYNHRHLAFRLKAAPGLVDPAKRDRLIMDVTYRLGRVASDWRDGRNLDTTVTVCEPIRRTGKYDDFVALALEDRDGCDGGYMHLYGWTEAGEG